MFKINEELLREKVDGKFAGFDLDHTIICPKNNRVFARDENDYIIMPGVSDTLKKLEKDSYTIVIFTNQGYSKFDDESFTRKVNKVFMEILGHVVPVYVGLKDPHYRKPCKGLYEEFLKVSHGSSLSFYVGDACTDDSFSYTDLKFALNNKLTFYDSREFFKGNHSPLKKVPHHPLDGISKDTELFKKTIRDVIPESQFMIILVGPPACGKSKISDFVKEICEGNKKGIQIISQDTLGTRVKCINMLKDSLEKGLSVIIDRKNEYEKDRKEFMEIAKNKDIAIRILHIDISKELSEHLSTYREIRTGKEIPSIVFNKYFSATKGLEDPSLTYPDITTKIPFIIADDSDPLMFEYLI